METLIAYTSFYFFLQEVANSPELDPTLTFNVGGQKSTRRSSFGRRVSFSVSTKIKEFRTDGPELTFWNSTYEEERSNINSDSSSHQSNSDVIADKTFCGNDDMEETGVLTKEQFNNENADCSSQRSSSNVTNNKTYVGNISMDQTEIINPNAGQVLSSLREKFGSKSTKQNNTEIASNETMDTTCAVSSLRDKKQGILDFSTQKSSTVVQDESMEMSATLNFQQKFGGSVIDMNNKTLIGSDSMDQTGILSNPEAGQVLTSLREKFGTKNTIENNGAVNKEVVSTMKNNAFNEEKLSMTNEKRHDNKTVVANDNMEFTEILPNSLAGQASLSMTEKFGSKSTKVPSMNVSASGVAPVNFNSDSIEPMEMTCTVSSLKGKKLDVDNIPSLKPTNFALNESMEMTAAVNIQHKIGSKSTNVPSMNMSASGVAPVNSNSDLIEPMEMTCTVSSLKGKEPEVVKIPSSKSTSLPSMNMSATGGASVNSNSNLIEPMEMTCTVPSLKSKKQNVDNISSTKSTTFALNESMEMTAAVNIQHEIEESVIEANPMSPNSSDGKTEGIPLIQESDCKMESDNNEPENEVASAGVNSIDTMEMTCTVSSLKRKKQEVENIPSPKATSFALNESMEMTAAVDIQPKIDNPVIGMSPMTQNSSNKKTNSMPLVPDTDCKIGKELNKSEKEVSETNTNSSFKNEFAEISEHSEINKSFADKSRRLDNKTLLANDKMEATEILSTSQAKVSQKEWQQVEKYTFYLLMVPKFLIRNYTY